MTIQKIGNISGILEENSYKKFVVNKFFEDNILQKTYYPYQFDGWKEKKYYGLINNKGESIYPKNSSLLNYTDNNNIHTNVTFVVDAFKDLQIYYRSLLSNNKLSKNGSIYNNLTVTKSTEILDTKYVNDVNDLYALFKTSFLNSQKLNKISSIDTFFIQFLDFLKIILKISSITRSEFLKSKLSSINFSGLVIAFSNSNAFSATEIKVNKYMADPNFDSFIDAARRFGFFVDRNAPWRIIADLESPVMADYYKNYGFYSVDSLHESYYTVAYLEDLDTLINVVCGFWNAFVSDFGTVTNYKDVPDCSSLFVERSVLSQIDIESFKKYFGITWQLRFYLFCRVLETKLKIKQNKFENIFQEALKIERYVSKQESLRYINTTIQELSTTAVVENLNLTTPDELANLIVRQQQDLPVEGINF